MTEEELINNAKEYLKAITKKPKDEYGISTEEAGNAIKWALEHQWISVDDKLPKNNSNIIIHCTNGYIGNAYWYKEKGQQCIKANINSDFDIDYWMPIPQIPKL